MTSLTPWQVEHYGFPLDQQGLTMKIIIAWLPACALVLFALSMADPVRAQDAHGAIAVGQSDYGESVAYGLAWNYASRSDAKEAARNACRHSGGTDCMELAWFQNGCGTLVLDEYGNAQAKSAMTQDQAEERAMRTCEDRGGSGCAVVGSQCASPGGQAGTWSGSEHVLAVPETDDEQTEAVEASDEFLALEHRIRVQKNLAALGFDPGPADGLFGPKTRAAIWEWQNAKGLEATGYLTREEAEALGTLVQAVESYNEEPNPSVEEPDEPSSEESSPEPSASQNLVLHFPQCSDLVSKDEAIGELGCWQETASHQECYFLYPPHFIRYWWEPGPLFAWSGVCQHGLANGRGTLTIAILDAVDPWTYDLSGTLVEGRMQGDWVGYLHGHNYGNSQQYRMEASFVDGVHGRAVVWRANSDGLFEGTGEIYQCRYGKCE